MSLSLFSIIVSFPLFPFLWKSSWWSASLLLWFASFCNLCSLLISSWFILLIFVLILLMVLLSEFPSIFLFLLILFLIWLRFYKVFLSSSLAYVFISIYSVFGKTSEKIDDLIQKHLLSISFWYYIYFVHYYFWKSIKRYNNTEKIIIYIL